MPELSKYRFAKTHEWVVLDGETATVGITDHAQQQLGDVIFVELPAVGTALKAGDRFGTIESVKAASDLYTPVSGTVSALNAALESTPEVVNSDPYDAGWMIKLDGVAVGGDALLDETTYADLTR